MKQETRDGLAMLAAGSALYVIRVNSAVIPDAVESLLDLGIFAVIGVLVYRSVRLFAGEKVKSKKANMRHGAR